MAKIVKVWAREILDSRGVPTIESMCQLDSGHVAVSPIPSGASTGTYEALELRDSDPARYKGKGVLKAVDNLTKILGPAIVGMDPSDQEAIDKKMIALDGTENKTKLGANSILAVSEVVCKVGAMANGQPLYKWIMALAQKKQIQVTLDIPTPLFNMING